jgi:hypothetical protein
MSVAIPTQAEVELMTPAKLIATFNSLAPTINLKTVKKFETRQIGIKRLTQVVDVLLAQVAKAGEARKANGIIQHGEFIKTVDAAEAAAIQNGTPLHTTPETSMTITGVPVVQKSSKEKVAELAAKAGVKAAKAPKAAPEPKAEKAAAVTVASRCRELALSGKTNQEIWAIVQPEFSLPAEKKSYPGWYRAQLKREGKI